MKKIIKIVTFYDDGTFTESVPYVGAPMPNIPMNPTYPPYNPTCGKCGLKLDTVMGYVCPNLDCPTGLGPVRC